MVSIVVSIVIYCGLLRNWVSNVVSWLERLKCYWGVVMWLLLIDNGRMVISLVVVYVFSSFYCWEMIRLIRIVNGNVKIVRLYFRYIRLDCDGDSILMIFEMDFFSVIYCGWVISEFVIIVMR